MNYERRVKNESQFRQGARGRSNFSQLYQNPSWKPGASNWATPELFAARAICMPERSLMTPLSGFYPKTINFDEADPNIASFYAGYEDMDDYFQNNMYENLALGANGCHMRIYPTKWLDFRKRDHREDIILHVYALLEWANSLP